jgi:hypothetical protein
MRLDEVRDTTLPGEDTGSRKGQDDGEEETAGEGYDERGGDEEQVRSVLDRGDDARATADRRFDLDVGVAWGGHRLDSLPRAGEDAMGQEKRRTW